MAVHGPVCGLRLKYQMGHPIHPVSPRWRQDEEGKVQLIEGYQMLFGDIW